MDAATGRSLTYGELAHQVERAAAGFAAERPRARATWWRSSPPTRPSGSSPATARSRRAAWSAASTRSGPPTRSPRRSTTPPPGSSSPSARSRRPPGPPPRRRASAPGWCCSTGTSPRHRSALADLLACPDPAPDVVIDPAVDLALLPYSSGTTGLPKGVMLTHRACIANVLQTVAALQIGPDDRTLAVAPFSHAVGWGVVANCALRDGATVVTLPRFEPHAFLGAIQEHRITQTVVVPPVVLALARHPAVAEYDLSSLYLAGLRRGPAGRRPAAGVHGPARDPGRAGLRDDRGRRHDRGRPHRHPGHRRDRAGSCCPACRAGSTRSTGELWIRSAALMTGYLGQPRRHGRHRRRRGLAAHRRRRPLRRERRAVRRRPDQRADQGEGLPGGARRAGGRAARRTPRSPTRR